MTRSGTLTHIDLSVGDPNRSIVFYDALLTGLGYRRIASNLPGFAGDEPRRAGWSLKYPDGGSFAIEVRPADDEKRERRYDRYAPGPHHLAFHADTRERVDQIHASMRAIGAEVLDPPFDYSGQAAYSEGYYAVFFADPDGVKLEVVHLP